MDREIGPQDNLTALTAGHRATARKKRLKGKNSISVTFDVEARVYATAQRFRSMTSEPYC